MAIPYTMYDHDNALMLCAHWATSDADKTALSHFAARISMREKVDAEDALVYRRCLENWEKHAVTKFYVADQNKEPISEDFSDEASARAHQKLIGGAKVMWRQSWPMQTNA